MKVKYEVLIAFLSHLHHPSSLLVRPATHTTDAVFITDEQSSSISQECIYQVSKNKVYSITTTWHEHLLSLAHDENAYPEFRKEYAHLLKDTPFEIERPRQPVLPPFDPPVQNAWIDDLSDDDEVCYMQIQGLLPLGKDVQMPDRTG